MTKRLTTLPLRDPSHVSNLAVDQIQSGVVRPPVEQIKIFSPQQWEEFIEEWAHSLKSKYSQVVRCGGAGDKGRDVIGYVTSSAQSPWDNYQCKHYDHPLYPGDAWPEIAKLCYYSWIGEYSWPRAYHFVAPHGVGTTLQAYIRQPSTLKERLIAAWDDTLAAKISSTGDGRLSGGLEKFVDNADFSVFTSLSPVRVIEEHRKTPWFGYRFGGGLPPMPPDLTPPQTVAPGEIRYVRELLDAYADHLALPIGAVEALDSHNNLRDHFNRARQEFYTAETLRNFSRDTLQPGEYERLQEEFHSGIIDTVSEEHADGYVRVLETVKVARSLSVTSHPLVPRLKIRARGGICHQLANEERIKWVRPKKK